MIGYVVGVVAHFGEPFHPRGAGLALEKIGARGHFAFEGVAVGGEPGFGVAMFIGDTLNVVLADARPEFADCHLSTDA
ncbi:hypothetical protein BTO20_36970 (plasmid) [Mycobacterium dioxanotrophicus]|uniref:Uncharacterized protein n=1 Tax=Mycobacterium dioxanotrophicus TaxID=482462 RepID=A0A1Y0CGR3_9MYCO|nr:hypothetical protein BTO20_36970 [Mycobacterium dioxanotrophicus]